MKQSGMWKLNLLDIGKSLLVVMLTAFVTSMGQALEIWYSEPSFSFDKVSLMLALKAGIGAGLAYLIKNFLTPAPKS